MAIRDLFSRRHKKPPETLQHDELPRELRVQLCHILRDDLGREVSWTEIANAIAREHGLIELPGEANIYDRSDPGTDCLNYVLQAPTLQALDLVELSMHAYLAQMRYTPGNGVQVIEEVNHRFQQHGCGFQFENGRFVRTDSNYIHAEAVTPAFKLLADEGYVGADAEFASAHAHFRQGRFESAVVDACKAFESTMKTICQRRRWKHDAGATANVLIGVLIKNGLVHGYSQEQLGNLHKCLLGLATVRNKNGGHGAGAAPRDLPEHWAAYALHLAASNIVFLVQCDQKLAK